MPPDQTEDDFHTWAKGFAEAVCVCFNEIEGSDVGLDFRYGGPEQKLHDDYVFLFAPKPVEISGGADDGDLLCEPLSVNIQDVQRLFTTVESVDYSAARGDDLLHRRHVEIVGQVGDRSLTIYIFDEPFNDAEVEMVLGARGLRPK